MHIGHILSLLVQPKLPRSPSPRPRAHKVRPRRGKFGAARRPILLGRSRHHEWATLLVILRDDLQIIPSEKSSRTATPVCVPGLTTKSFLPGRADWRSRRTAERMGGNRSCPSSGRFIYE
eukprot:s3674_g2.t1